MNEYQNSYYQGVDEMYQQIEAGQVSPLVAPQQVVSPAPAPKQSERDNWIVRWSPLLVFLIIIVFALVCMYGR